MKPCRISEADVVMNVNNGAEAWKVAEVIPNDAGRLNVTLTNQDESATNTMVTASERNLKADGFRGFKDY